jgi:hypothetical protein
MDKDDIIIKSLKARYFDVISKENIPHTPKLTDEADKIEAAIRELTQKEQTATNAG